MKKSDVFSVPTVVRVRHHQVKTEKASVEASKIKIDFLFDKKVEVTGSYITLNLIRESFQAAVRRLH